MTDTQIGVGIIGVEPGRSWSSETFYAVVDADYQTQVNAMRSVHNDKMKP